MRTDKIVKRALKELAGVRVVNLGIGGAMELAQKRSRVIILCSHNNKRGNPKIVSHSKLPWTAPYCVSHIITDKAVMDVTEAGLYCVR